MEKLKEKKEIKTRKPKGLKTKPMPLILYKKNNSVRK